jgi:hypothetical protein
MTMPPGVFDHIMDYVPLPRIWEDSLLRILGRAKLLPPQAIADTSRVVDEILNDCLTFTTARPTRLLIDLSRNKQVFVFFLRKMAEFILTETSTHFLGSKLFVKRIALTTAAS